MAKILKNLFLLSATLLITLYLFLWADLDKSNRVLSLVGLPENTGLKYSKEKIQIDKLEKQKTEIASKISDLKSRIKNKRYTQKQGKITTIQKIQNQWFDIVDLDKIIIDETNMKDMGILSIPNKIQEFFNSSDFSKKTDATKLDSRRVLYDNHITIENISIQNNKLKISGSAYNLYDQAFFLSSSFIESINQFPQLSGGSAKNYTKKTNQSGKTIMKFNISFDVENIRNKDKKEIEKSIKNDFISEFLVWRNQAIGGGKSTVRKTEDTIRRIRRTTH